jgi:hypothetical protein
MGGFRIALIAANFISGKVFTLFGGINSPSGVWLRQAGFSFLGTAKLSRLFLCFRFL